LHRFVAYFHPKLHVAGLAQALRETASHASSKAAA
jgi:hypothetical protein